MLLLNSQLHWRIYTPTPPSIGLAGSTVWYLQCVAYIDITGVGYFTSVICTGETVLSICGSARITAVDNWRHPVHHSPTCNSNFHAFLQRLAVVDDTCIIPRRLCSIEMKYSSPGCGAGTCGAIITLHIHNKVTWLHMWLSDRCSWKVSSLRSCTLTDS